MPRDMSQAGLEDDLTDEQIDQLLARATARLKDKAKDAQIEKKRSLKNYNFPKLDAGKLEKPYVSVRGDIAAVDSNQLLQEEHRKQANSVRKVEDPVSAKELALGKKKSTAGRNWFDLPKTELTPELKRDLQLIKMRDVLDPHRHYKKEGGKMRAPEFSQVGTIIEGSAEFLNGRIENKNRKRTFVEEVLAGEQETGRFKRKYGELQDKRSSGKKAFYKALKAKRKGGVKKSSAG